MTKEPDLPLTPADVAEIISLVDTTSYETLELTTPRFTLKIARTESGGWTQDWRHAATPRPMEDAEAPAAAAASPATLDEGSIAIRAPLPGTFYRAPRPGAKPFAETGDTLESGAMIGMIETMKVMNSVAAPAAGTVTSIHAENGQLVKQDEILVILRPGGPIA